MQDLKIQDYNDLEETLQRVRLGDCEVCKEKSKYSCPKCEVKTCSLNCSKIHKKELNCNGIRDKTKYIPLKQMTKSDMMNDYYFLEESTNFLKKLKDNKSVKNQGKIPQHLMKLKKLAFEKKVRLYYLTNDFAKRKSNKTSFNKLQNEIIWQLEIVFPNASDFKVDVKFSDNDLLYDILDTVINKTEDENTQKQLEYYRSQGLKNFQVLLKSEGLKNCKSRYYVLNLKKSLKQNLMNKIIIEYPSIYIMMNCCVGDFEKVDDDDKNLEAEMEEFRKSLQTEMFHNKDHSSRPDNRKRPGQPLPADGIQNKKQNKELVTAESDGEEVKPENYFFTKDL